MKRNGEIARFDCGSHLYIMTAKSVPCRFGDAIWLDFFISRRTAKKRGIKDKYMSRYALGSDGGIHAIKYFLTFLNEYLATYKPEYLAICPADDQNKKRTDFYCRRLFELGYNYVCRDRDEYGNEMYWVALYRRFI
jgi:hypothetical protein